MSQVAFCKVGAKDVWLLHLPKFNSSSLKNANVGRLGIFPTLEGDVSGANC